MPTHILWLECEDDIVELLPLPSSELGVGVPQDVVNPLVEMRHRVVGRVERRSVDDTLSARGVRCHETVLEGIGVRGPEAESVCENERSDPEGNGKEHVAHSDREER